MKYVVGSRLSTLAFVRMQLDSLCIGVVPWMPYEEHSAVRPFEWISLFSGYIRLRACRQMHLPKRVLRQYGYIQCDGIFMKFFLNQCRVWGGSNE